MEGFVKISKYAGMREDLVQAGGGNSSFKISDDRMAIKASGYQLADVTYKEGYALVNPSIIRKRFLEVDDLSSITEENSKSILRDAFIEGARPSIETFLHAISSRYTLHTHPIVVNALTCRKDGMGILKKLFPDALIVPYATPGVELAKTYFYAYKSAKAEKNRNIDIVFLQNHGLVISGESADEVIERTEYVTKTIEGYLATDFNVYHTLSKIWELFPSKIVWKVTDYNILKAYEEIGTWDCNFCPDSVVFLGKGFLRLDSGFSAIDVDEYIKCKAYPVIVDLDGELYIIADSVKKALEIQSVMSFSAQVMTINRNVECNLLSDSEQNYLLNWDAEKYRKNI